VSDLDEDPKQADELTSNRYRWAWWWGATALWMSVIFLASTWPGHGPPAAQGIDKVLHFAAYAVLTVLLFRCRQVTGHGPQLAASACYAATIAIVYGLLLELCQLWVPGRECQWSDILANCAGVVITALLMLYFYRNRSSAGSYHANQ